MYTFLGNLVVGAVIAVLSAYIAAHLAIRRFCTERWWERKVDTYFLLIDSLHDIKEQIMYLLAALRGDSVLEDQESQLREKADAAFEQIARIADRSMLLLPPKACDIMNEMQEMVSRSGSSDADYEAKFKDCLKVIEDCLHKLGPIARADLSIRYT